MESHATRGFFCWLSSRAEGFGEDKGTKKANRIGGCAFHLDYGLLQDQR